MFTYFFLIPFLGCLFLLWVPSKWLACLLSLSTLLILLFFGNSIFGEEILYPWFEALSIHLHLKIDPLSLVFVYLVAFIFPIVIASLEKPSTLLLSLILFLQGLLLIFFSAKDLALFTIFWEATLIPLYFIITLFGKEGSQRAALKFMVYMIAGSALMVAATLSLYFSALHNLGMSTFNLDNLQNIASSLPHASLLLSVFLLAFAVKMPLFPFHGWLPETYVKASTAGTILLSAILSKTAVYGILRIGYGLFDPILVQWTVYLLPVAIFGVIYGGFAAWMQNDYKRLIAYSSFSHVNFIAAGLFVINETARSGALLQVINHGIIITGLFLVASFLEKRIHTTLLDQHRGLLADLPRLCWLTLIFVLASVAIPGTNSFVGEFLIFLGMFHYSPLLTFVLGLSIILSVIYMLRYMELNFFGEAKKGIFADIGTKEFLIALPLIILIFFIGIYPQPFLEMIEWR